MKAFLSICLAAALLSGAFAAEPAGYWASPRELCRIADQRIGEASGIAASRRNPGIFYIHNDSGDSARFFAIGRDGATRFTATVKNATNTDWEDIAGARVKGRPVVYLADIGDNARRRTTLTIYEVPDPAAPRRKGGIVTVRARAIRFRYPDGAHDAETLMAEPNGAALYVVTKSAKREPSGVYRIDPAAVGVQTARKLGQMVFSDPLPIYPDMATGGDIAPDGSRFVVRTYQCAYEWTIRKGETLEQALSRKPERTMLALETQGEAICYGLDGRTLYTTTEQRPAPVYEYIWRLGVPDAK